MTLAITFRRPARLEFDEAANWYEERRFGLGTRFVSAIDSVIWNISSNPWRYAEVFEETREAIVPGFPYCVYYRVETKQIVILSVFHSARDPMHWRARK